MINRTVEKAERLAKKYGEFADIHVVKEENNINADIVSIQALLVLLESLKSLK
ncbi:MAG: hypothetical protein Ct9H90mP6_10160 [Gammaproteobacteria bacterium]|nr:MAG: hypothetical protein Ct9H90mP6_10160 [Gammaproteobacteria bacterium]